MLRCVRAWSHAFFGNVYAADLFPSRGANDLLESCIEERTLRSATCSAAASIVHLVASARLELGRDEKNSTEGNYEIPFDDYRCTGIARNSTGDFDRS
jgi:hypothetical protein